VDYKIKKYRCKCLKADHKRIDIRTSKKELSIATNGNCYITHVMCPVCKMIVDMRVEQ
jgi:hypothetical protein